MRSHRWPRVPGTTTIEFDDGEEPTPLCLRDLDVQTLVIEWESTGSYDPGDYWTPPWGQEERNVVGITATLRDGREYKLGQRDRDQLEKEYQNRIDAEELEPA
jgi:hypothetical protein